MGADKAYDTHGFVNACRESQVTPHVAQNMTRAGGSALGGRIKRHPGYAIRQRDSECIGQCFAWDELIGPIRQVMVRGLDGVDQLLWLTIAACRLARLRTLAELRPQCG